MQLANGSVNWYGYTLKGSNLKFQFSLTGYKLYGLLSCKCCYNQQVDWISESKESGVYTLFVPCMCRMYHAV